MIPLPDDISSRDVYQWLDGGWCLGRVDGVTKPMQFAGCCDDVDWIMLNDTDGKSHQLDPENVFATWPRCGAVNMDDVAFFVMRSQRRQWRRTYNSRVLRLVIPRKWEVMKLCGMTTAELHPDHPRVVEAVFSPTYVPVGDAMRELRAGDKVSRAICPHIILTATGTDSLLVYYKGDYVASISEENKLLPVNADRNTLRRLLKYFQERVTL